MSHTFHHGAIDIAIATAREDAAAVPLEEYDLDDVMTVHISTNRSAVDNTLNSGPSLGKPSIEVPAVDFPDFTLDLSVLSTSPSSTSITSPEPSSPPSSAGSVLHSSVSSPRRRSSEHIAPQLSPRTKATLLRDSSWSMRKYIGRGTPIDRRRREQWAGSLAFDDINEDGQKMSHNPRSSSLDSALRPQITQRSITPDWDLVSAFSVHRPLSPLGGFNRESTAFSHHTDISVAQTLDVEVDESSEDWSALMESVLDSAAASSTSSTHTPTIESAETALPRVSTPPPSGEPPAPANDADEETRTSMFGPRLVVAASDSPTRFLETTLREGFGPVPLVPLFNLEVLPPPGRASPSVYSTPPSTPTVSRPTSVHGVADDESSSLTSSSKSSSLSRSLRRTSIGAKPWWRRVVARMNRMRLRRLLRSRSR